MTRQLTVGEADFTIVLPGTWVSVPLEGDDRAKAEIASFVKRQVGMNDRLARLRRDAREQLLGMAASARAAGAFRVGLSLEILPGIPFPAALVMHFQPWPAGGGAAAGPERLRTAFPDAEPLDLDCGPTVRRSSVGRLQIGAASTQEVRLDYWMPVPSGDRLLHLSVDVPSPGDPALYTELFDAIVDSVRWAARPAPAEAAR
ncbi:hypothetical protein [Leifsonia sp. AG29]|uniref:hypothetical protein n=1 Tax=Leifsonia sp. AG29 TaxID=2598860 RepID=UPI00131E09F2|nr:hypothetical protein [Leifsonia sp. AG29]